MIRAWYSLRISETDFSLLNSALEELLASSDLSTLTNDFLSVATPDQLGDLKSVWQTWVHLSTQGVKGLWVTERRQAAFQRDDKWEERLNNYLNSIPQQHRQSASDWVENGLFTSKCKVSWLTRENVTLTGSSFQWNKGKSDFDFSMEAKNIPFTGWDYKLIKNMLYIIRCDCMAIEPFLPVELKYDRITTSNLSDYISLTGILAKFKEYLNTTNNHSVLVTEVINWGNYLPDVRDEIKENYTELAEKVVQDTNNPLLVLTNLISLVEYHNLIPDFQLYLRAALVESRSEEELASLAKKKRLPSIKTIVAALGLELRDYVRKENTIFPTKWAVNCRRVNLLSGDEFSLEWKLLKGDPFPNNN